MVIRYQVRCPELRYRLAPIEEYRGRENASAVLYFADVRIEVFNCVFLGLRYLRASTVE